MELNVNSELNVNAELNNNWNLYLHYKNLGKYYNDNIEKIAEMKDIITFWRVFNNIPKIYEIFSDGVNYKKMKKNNSIPCAYSFFKENITPCWEDPLNKNGFEFSVKSCKNLDNFNFEWMNCILEVISNNNELYEHINGIRVVDCTKFNSVLYRIEIWVDLVEYKDSIEQILKSNAFGFKKYKLLYRTHSDIKEQI